jgi:hypothetical protein
MNRLQFWVLTYSVIFVAPFFLTDIFLGRYVREEENKVVLLERVAQEGNVYANRWQQLAVRIYQGSQQDPELRSVLVRQHVNITAKPAPATAPAPEPPAPQPTKAGTTSRAQ